MEHRVSDAVDRVTGLGVRFQNKRALRRSSEESDIDTHQVSKLLYAHVGLGELRYAHTHHGALLVSAEDSYAWLANHARPSNLMPNFTATPGWRAQGLE